MTREEHLLTILAEECGEVTQRACKALRFTLPEKQTSDHKDNAVRLVEELNDLFAVAKILEDEGYIKGVFDPDHVEYKLDRIEKYLERSIEHGKYEENGK